MRTIRALGELVEICLAFIKWLRDSARGQVIKKEVEDATKSKDSSDIERRLND